MNVNEFSYLEAREQLEVFWSGTFVGELNYGDFRIVCHQVDDFYIEFKILAGYYLDVRTFTNTDLLEPYLQQIDISGLV